MVEEKPDKFKLGMDKDVEEVLPVLPEVQPKERGRSSAGVYILLAIIIIGATVAYFDLYRRVNRSQSVGANQIDSLDHRLLTLFDKLTTLEKQVNQSISADQEVLKGIEEQLKKASATVSATNKELTDKAKQSEMNTAIAALKKEVNQADAKAGESLEMLNGLKTRLDEIKPLSTDLEKLKTGLDATREDLSGEINEITLQLDRSSKSLIELQSKATLLTKSKSDHQAKIDLLKKQIADLKKDADIYVGEILKIKKQLKTHPLGTPGQSSQPVPSSGSAASSSTPTVKSGDLLQQTLKE